MKRLEPGRNGFTLIEVIAVLVILGIVAAIAMPKFFDMQRAAEAKTLFTAYNDLISRANACYTKSMVANNGAAVAADCDSFNELGLSSIADITGAYQNYAGTWAWAAGVITYTYKNSGATATATFTLVGGTSTAPPTITFAGSS